MNSHTPLVGIGCMRLSTAHDRDDTRAIEVLHAALDAGATLLDTADAYCWDERDTGHNERLITRALASWCGDRSRIIIATKGGLTRPNSEWVADGRARHLTAACQASIRALEVERIQLYQLHAPDPRVPLSTSVRALAALKRDRLVEHLGLCNVTVGQIEEARRITDIAAVQVELNVWHDDNVLSGVAGYCLRNGIRLIAHRPLGGPQRQRRIQSDAVLAAVAARHGVAAADIALAWLTGLSPAIVPIPGPTHVETAAAVARVRSIHLSDEDRVQLDERFPHGAMLRQRSADHLRQGDDAPPKTSAQAAIALRTRSREANREPDAAAGEVVIIMGLPGAGKSTAARAFVEQGYARLNRDDDGGSLRSLLPALDALVEGGTTRIVLDNTYVSRKSRGAVIQAASKRGLPVRCVWLSTSVEDAQVNAVSRMVGKFGRLLGPEEIRQTVKHDISAFGPAVQFRYQRELEPPDPAEGFSRIDTISFERVPEASFLNRALIVWCDASSVAQAAQRRDVLQRYAAEGWRILGVGWQPGIAEKTMTVAEADAVYARLRAELDVEIDIVYCPHGGGPPVCWCRKPLPGLGVMLIHRYELDPAQCIYVGSGPQDPGFARRLGFQYRDARDFFA